MNPFGLKEGAAAIKVPGKGVAAKKGVPGSKQKKKPAPPFPKKK